MLGHYLMEEAEEGADLGGADDQVEVEEVDSADAGEPGDPDAEGEEVVVSIEGEEHEPEETEERAASWVTQLRKERRELQRENKELRAKIQAAEPKPSAPQLGKKPTLEECDYDGEKFEQELTAWHDRKRQIDEQQRQQEASQKQQQEAWQAKLDGYATAKAGMKVTDYEDAEAMVEGALDVTKQGAIISGSENPALLVYALGKNPKILKDLAAIDDPVKFIFAVAKLEAKLKVEKRKPASQPEKTVTGSAPKSAGASEAHLERLREEAAKTGDYSKVSAYKRQLKEKERAKA
jgi:hypothetical protein